MNLVTTFSAPYLFYLNSFDEESSNDFESFSLLF